MARTSLMLIGMTAVLLQTILAGRVGRILRGRKGELGYSEELEQQKNDEFIANLKESISSIVSQLSSEELPESGAEALNQAQEALDQRIQEIKFTDDEAESLDGLKAFLGQIVTQIFGQPGGENVNEALAELGSKFADQVNSFLDQEKEKFPKEKQAVTSQRDPNSEIDETRQKPKIFGNLPVDPKEVLNQLLPERKIGKEHICKRNKRYQDGFIVFDNRFFYLAQTKADSRLFGCLAAENGVNLDKMVDLLQQLDEDNQQYKKRYIPRITLKTNADDKALFEIRDCSLITNQSIINWIKAKPDNLKDFVVQYFFGMVSAHERHKEVCSIDYKNIVITNDKTQVYFVDFSLFEYNQKGSFCKPKSLTEGLVDIPGATSSIQAERMKYQEKTSALVLLEYLAKVFNVNEDQVKNILYSTKSDTDKTGEINLLFKNYIKDDLRTFILKQAGWINSSDTLLVAIRSFLYGKASFLKVWSDY